MSDGSQAYSGSAVVVSGRAQPFAGKQHEVAIVTCEYPPFPGGIGTYAAGIEGALRASGVATLVVAPDYPSLPPVVDSSDTQRVLGHHKISPAGAWRTMQAIRSLPRTSTILAADLRTVVLTYLITRFFRRNYVAMVHGSEASKFQSRSLAFRLARKAYLSAGFVAYNSHATAQIFRSGIGIPRADAVTHLGVDARWFLPPGEQSFEHPNLAAIKDGVPIICSVGRIEARKGQINTVRALALARDRFGLLNCVYVIAGKVEEPKYADAIQREADRLGIDIILAGRLSEDDLKLLYRRSACHALLAETLPGKIEGFGLVLLEAAAQGCPSVATDVGGIPEVLAETGTIVDQSDSDRVAKAFADYGLKKDWSILRGEAARVRANLFTWRKCAQKTFANLNLGPIEE